VRDPDDAYPRIDLPPADDAGRPRLLRLVLVAAIAGVAIGVVGGLFRLALAGADLGRDALLEWAREEPALRWVIPVVLAAVAVALARLIVRLVPSAAGSGIQHVEASMRMEAGFTTWRVIPAKFVGGVLALGAGMALGREGPTVQMGAAIGAESGRIARLDDHDRRTLEAALAGAGLGVAFSAPIGGAVFVIEEVARAVRTRLVMATLVATATAMGVARLIVGGEPVFPVPVPDAGPIAMLTLFAALGALLGALGPLYNRLTILLLDVTTSLSRRVPPEVIAGAIGGVIGIVGVLDPALVGQGETTSEAILLGQYAIGGLIVIAVVRWFLGPLSYSAGTPGGLFAPLLIVGAAIGALVAETATRIAPGLDASPTAFAIVAMSAFFTAVVRAPLTGIVLVAEMTGTLALLVPMVVASAAALIVATALRSPPIYDALRARMSPHQP
jgi:CIC family chloride channel protein